MELTSDNSAIFFGGTGAVASEFIRRTNHGTLIIEAAEDVIIQGERQILTQCPHSPLHMCTLLILLHPPHYGVCAVCATGERFPPREHAQGTGRSRRLTEQSSTEPTEPVEGGASTLELKSYVHALMLALTEERRATYRMRQEFEQLKARVAVLEGGEAELDGGEAEGP